MHPIFFSSRGMILAFGIWLAVTCVCSGLMVWLDWRIWSDQSLQMSTGHLATALALFIPWYGIFLFVCLSNFYLCLRLPLDSSGTTRIAITQGASAIAALGFWLLSGNGWAKMLDAMGTTRAEQLFNHTLPINAAIAAVLYAVWILWHYMHLQARAHENNSSEDLQQKLLLNEVELQAIKAAMHPHFLYNSLNMLANISLVAPDKIHNLCVQMSDFLRYSLNYSNKPQVTIADEVTHINNYLKIERERSGPRLQVIQSIAAAADNFPVFPLLLFPLIENAIKHGIDSSLEPGFIELSISMETGQLTIRVRNSCDPAGCNRQGTGHGLSSLQKRLTRFYHQRATLKTQFSNSVFEAIVQLPSEEK